ncbi:MAG TPA: DUF3306 domain-containing protein [Burkholderiales bacterium]|nr:DUF3306 domain-containing protein [Burkholderiales bacterium]
MARDPQDFLRRWSRRKQDAAAQAKAPAAKKDEPVPALPPLDSLTFESDFKAFMHAKVEESVKRAALKKLFADPRFNVIDQMDIYIDDYTNLETIPKEMLDKLEHARATLFGRPEEKKAEAAARTEVAQAPAEPQAEEPQKKTDDGAAG